MSDHQHCINCLEEVEGSYLYPCVQCGWSPDQYSETGLYLSPGTILNNQYQIGKMLGHGGFGITYLAWDNLLHRRLAIKEYMPRDFATRNATNSTISIYAGAATESFTYGLERFLDEARTLAKFQQHAGIVSVLNVFYGNSTGYMVMEYVEGRTLKDYLLEKGLLSWELTLQLFMPIMDALREVHKGGIMHRDISPDNIYLCNDNCIKLLDFGSARYALGSHSLSLSVVVKPGYAPEEQYRAKGKQGPWTDVYSVAASMYRCICGEVPPDALDRLDEDELVAPSNLGIQISQKAEAALLCALAIKANDRTQSIEAFQQEIWDQGINSERVINKVNATQKIFRPTTTKEEPTTIALPEQAINYVEEAMLELNTAIKNKYPLICMLKKIKLKWYLSCVVGVLILIIGNSDDWVEFKTGATGHGPDDLVEWYENKAVKGDAFAQYRLYQICRQYFGYRDTCALETNISWLIKSADQGLSDAQVTLGNAYLEGRNKDYQKAFEWTEKAARQGNRVGQHNLGLLYFAGEGVEKNYQMALKWFQKAADQGYEHSQNNLAEMYFNGLGVAQDYQLAFEWYKKAADQGDTEAQNSLGDMYHQGQGVELDDTKAFYSYKKAADQGDVKGLNNLAYMWRNGFGVKTPSYFEALKLYQKSADQGNDVGQYSLGKMYEEDHRQDEAIENYRLAAAQGNADAISALKRLGVQ